MDPRNTAMLVFEFWFWKIFKTESSVINTSTMVSTRDMELENDSKEEDHHTQNQGRNMEARKEAQPGTEL